MKLFLRNSVRNWPGEVVEGYPVWDVSAFGAHDISGVIGEGVSAGLYHRVARAAAAVLGARRAAVGYDARPSSPNFAKSALRGLELSGVQALDLGLCGTEEVHEAVAAGDLDLGLTVTASHSSIEFNGLKIVGRGARPISPEDFAEIRRRTEEGDFHDTKFVGVTEVASRPKQGTHARRVEARERT